MKIYEIGTGYTPIPARMGAATEIVVEELTRAFLKQNISVEIVDIASNDRIAHCLPIREVRVPGYFLGTDVQLGIMHKLKRVVYSIALAGELKKILTQAEEEVVLHFHNQYNLFFFYKLVPKELRKKAVIAYTNHSYIWHNPWNQIKDTVRKRYFQEVYCMEHADYVFVLNEQTRKTILENLNVKSERLHLISNGVNTDIYNALSCDCKTEIKKRWNLLDKRVLIQVGSVCDRKNQLGALRNLLPLLEQEKDVVFCYAGGIIDRDYQSCIHALAEEYGVSDRVKYMGELQPGEKLNAFYNLAEAMVFPSKAEGFSLVILESMSAGTPVLIGNNLKFELAQECICCEDAELCDIIWRDILNKDRQKTFAEKARRVIEKKYSWDSIACEYMHIWNDAVT